MALLRIDKIRGVVTTNAKKNNIESMRLQMKTYNMLFGFDQWDVKWHFFKCKAVGIAVKLTKNLEGWCPVT